MKKTMPTLFLSLFLSLPFVLTAQEKSDWKEMNSFHTLMSASFHPAEEGNLKPLQAKSDSLLITAKKWKASKIPAGFKPAETAETLTKLVKQLELVNNSVKAKQDDATLKMQIKEAHEIFHTIVEKCRVGE
jgi:hypothetical protein